jgi:hypothetical protein
MQQHPALLLIPVSSSLLTFFSTCLYQKDERALPGNLNSYQFSSVKCSVSHYFPTFFSLSDSFGFKGLRLCTCCSFRHSQSPLVQALQDTDRAAEGVIRNPVACVNEGLENPHNRGFSGCNRFAVKRKSFEVQNTSLSVLVTK